MVKSLWFMKIITSLVFLGNYWPVKTLDVVTTLLFFSQNLAERWGGISRRGFQEWDSALLTEFGQENYHMHGQRMSCLSDGLSLERKEMNYGMKNI